MGEPSGAEFSQDLVLDAEELAALQTFHKSFNLPGLRFGLVNAVCRDDHFPPEDEQIASSPQHQPAAPAAAPEPSIGEEALAGTFSLLAQADALLGPAAEIAEEIAPSGLANGAHRGPRSGQPHASVRLGASSIAPVRQVAPVRRPARPAGQAGPMRQK